jgi:hypothetical protein
MAIPAFLLSVRFYKVAANPTDITVGMHEMGGSEPGCRELTHR